MPIRRLVLVLVTLLVSALPASAQITIRLRNDFIEQFKNRATIDATFTIDKAHKQPNPPSKDADIHVAGRAPEIQLPIVAEMMNAIEQPEALKTIAAAQGTGKPVPVNGAWRLWCEHGGTTDQIQGRALSPFTTTNPDHCFEIHPLTTVGTHDVRATLHPIDPGFQTKDAEQAFNAYEAVRLEITPDAAAGTTTLSTNGIGFNYVEFKLELNEDPTFSTADGGLFVMAAVQDLEDEMIVRNRRMVFLPGSDPLVKVKALKKCGRLHVLGVPRINFAILSWRVRNAAARPEVLRWNLPYEIIVVAVYDDDLAESDECAAQ